MRVKHLLASALLLAALAAPRSGRAAEAEGQRPACPPSLSAWTEIDLYFGRRIGRTGLVTEKMFRHFLAEEVTPRFPDGLTVLDAAGQFRDAHGAVVREPTKLLVLLVPDSAAVAGKIAAVIDRYKQRFRQQSVLRTEERVCLAFWGRSPPGWNGRAVAGTLATQQGTGAMQDQDGLSGLIAQARTELYSAVISDTLDAMGLREQALPAAIRPLDDVLVLCGWARVGLFLPIYAEDAHAYDEEIRLIDGLGRDEVPVLCCHGSLRLSVWGELMSTRAAHLGAAGVLTDGCVRDVRAIRELRFPVFAAGINPTDTKCRGRLVAGDLPGRIGGVAVASGDLVFGDADGVVVVPRAAAAEVVASALDKVRAEDTVREALRRGESLGEVFRRHGVL